MCGPAVCPQIRKKHIGIENVWARNLPTDRYRK